MTSQPYRSNGVPSYSTWATTSRTRQPAHSDGDSHSWGVSSRKSAARSRFSCCTIAYTRARDIGTSLL
ncbi:Uncharacterised protein [Mycobacteroides abscessus subsp. abscessus]|nr:Uncharacterised protein [Mycobacteroides abscessus subsp. abscessus]SKW02789.1 Uncharacterised protein [Mycobacteroides abscessus subsp. abscessus]